MDLQNQEEEVLVEVQEVQVLVLLVKVDLETLAGLVVEEDLEVWAALETARPEEWEEILEKDFQLSSKDSVVELAKEDFRATSGTLRDSGRETGIRAEDFQRSLNRTRGLTSDI